MLASNRWCLKSNFHQEVFRGLSPTTIKTQQSPLPPVFCTKHSIQFLPKVSHFRCGRKMATTHYHFPSTLASRSNPSLRLIQNLNLTHPNNSWLGTKIRVQHCSVSVKPSVSVFHRRPLAATVSFSLPTS